MKWSLLRCAISACDAYIKQVKIENSIELGYSFDGKANNSYMFPWQGKAHNDTRNTF